MTPLPTHTQIAILITIVVGILACLLFEILSLSAKRELDAEREFEKMREDFQRERP